jgi:hypothetical protein
MQARRYPSGVDGVAVDGVAPLRAIIAALRFRLRLAHGRHPSAALESRHVRAGFFIIFTWLTIRRQNDRLGLPYGRGAWSMIRQSASRVSETVMLHEKGCRQENRCVRGVAG